MINKPKISIKLIFSDSDPSKSSSLPESTSKTSSYSIQEGFGNDPTKLINNSEFINQIATALSKKLGSNPGSRPITENWTFYEKAQPTTSSGVVPADTSPPINFDNKICENDLNDSFDENQLLKFVPKRFKEKAKILLHVFDERPNEITWDHAGVIYIDQNSIPNSNIFTIFPYLFRRKVSKDIYTLGFEDFLKKIVDMNLGHLLNCNISSIHKTNSVKVESTETKTSKWWKLN